MTAEDRRRFREVGGYAKLARNIEHNIGYTPKPAKGTCGICWLNPISEYAYHVMWCDECLNLQADDPGQIDDFIIKRRTNVSFELQIRAACTGCWPQDNLAPRELCTCSCHEYVRYTAAIEAWYRAQG
jgi:hypothetical protein